MGKNLKKSKKAKVIIKNNCFTGIHWDKKATKAILHVAKGLYNLSKLFSSQNIHIDNLLEINKK